MRAVLFTIVLCFFIPLKSTSQVNDLSNLSQGEFLSFQALFDKEDNLFGYIAQFDLGETEKRVHTFEFIVYDKNLNRLLIEQLSGDNLVEKYQFELTKEQELLISPKVNFNNLGLVQAIQMGKNGVQNKVYKLNFESGEISEFDPPCYFAGELAYDCLQMNNSTMNKKLKAHKKKIGFYEQGTVEVLDDDKFLVRTRRTKNYQKFTDFQLIFFDENEREVWSYEYNVKASNKKQESVIVVDYSDDKLCFFQKNTNKKKTELFFKVINTKNGRLVTDQQIEGLSVTELNNLISPRSNLMKRSNDNNSLFTGAIIEDKGRLTGLFVAKLNSATNQLQYEIINYTESLASFVEEKMDKHGGINKFQLYPRDILLKDDGSFKLISELTKYEFDYSKVEVKSVGDLYVLDFNQNLTPINVETINKNEHKQERPNYLFSQKLNEDTDDMVFFYRDFVENEEDGDENWILYINTFDKNQLKQDQLKLTSKNDGYEIYPFVAKKGHILLHEFDENEGHNQIRLERLNVF